MKNTLKKLLALMLVLCMAVAVLVACTDPAETTGENETTTPGGNNGEDEGSDPTDNGNPPKPPVEGSDVIPGTDETDKADPLPEGDPEKDPAGADIF